MKFLFGKLVKEYMEEGEEMSWELQYALKYHDAPWAGPPFVRSAIRKLRESARSGNLLKIVMILLFVCFFFLAINFWK
jgi:hypothetical protein